VLTRVASESVLAELFGVPIVVDPNVPTNSGRSGDYVFVLRARDLALWELGVQTLVSPQTLAGTMTVLCSLWAYAAFAVRYPQSIALVGPLRNCSGETPHRACWGTVTLIEECSSAVGFGGVAMKQRWIVHISGGSVERGDLTPDREAVNHLGSPLGRAEQMPSGPKVRTDAAEGGQEPLGMARRFEAFHRPFTLSGALMRVLGPIVQIPRPPVFHR
jgi:hypothetical protein